jgi:hypothetical protein
MTRYLLRRITAHNVQPLPMPVSLQFTAVSNMKKYTVTFQVNLDNINKDDSEILEYYLKDLLVTSVLPALNSELVPLTMTVKAARK